MGRAEWTRRRLLQVLGGAAATTLAAGALAYREARQRAAEVYRHLVALPPGPQGTLPPDVLAALMAATKVLLPKGIELERYEDFFRWHAEEAPGYLPLYTRFREVLDAAARPASSFAEAPLEAQRAILAKARRVRETLNADDKLGGARIAVFDRDWLHFERYIAREILTLFARTDAWLLSGYGPHPGLPRGLEAYRRPPEAS